MTNNERSAEIRGGRPGPWCTARRRRTCRPARTARSPRRGTCPRASARARTRRTGPAPHRNAAPQHRLATAWRSSECGAQLGSWCGSPTKPASGLRRDRGGAFDCCGAQAAVLIAAVSSALRSLAHSWRRSSWFDFKLKQRERTREAKLACCVSRAARALERASATHRRYASGYSGKSGFLCSRAASKSAAARPCGRGGIPWMPRPRRLVCASDDRGRGCAGRARGAARVAPRGH